MGLLLPVLLLLLFMSYFLKRYSFRWLFGLLLSCICFVGGIWWMNRQLQQDAYSFPEKETTYYVVLTEKPEIKAKSLLCHVRLKERLDSLSVTAINKEALIYLSLDSSAQCLQRGDELLVLAYMAPPVNNRNFDEFDYGRYLAHKGISGTGFVSDGSWKVIAHTTSRTMLQVALDYREKVLSLYRELGFQGDEFAVLSALTVGYKEELSEDIRESYSVAGASHVLALSGLHIGFLYALIFFCLKRLPDKWKGVKLLRVGVVLILLWSFAFFTGLSPSVVRSVIMFSFFTLSGLWERESFSLNTLAIAAFFMLLCCPAWLFDVGFQLSFCAVVAILLIQPLLYRLIPVHRRAGKYVWGLISVSIAAQIGTAPLVLFYFSSFSTHFLLTNLLVIPLVSIIMYAAVIMLLLSPFTILQSFIVVLVKELVEILNLMVQWVEHLPWSSIGNIWVYPLEISGIYVALLLGVRYFTSHNSKSLIVFLFCLLAISGYHVAMQMNDRPRRSLVFYNVKGCPVAHCIAADGRSWLAYADSVPNESRLYRVASNYWRHNHLKQPLAITSDYTDAFFFRRDKVLSFGDCRLCMINDNRWRNKTAVRPLSLDYLYLCKGYDGRLEWLTGLFQTKCVILDSSLTEYRKKAFSEECRQLGIHFISLSDEGSVRFLL